MDYAQFIADCLARMEALTSDAEQFNQTEFDQLDEWVTAARAEVDSILARNASLAAAQEALTRAGSAALETPAPRDVPNINTHTDVYDFSDLPQERGARVRDLNSRALDLVEKSRSFHEDDHRESATVVLEQTGGRAAQQILLSEHPDYQTGYMKYMMGRSEEMTTDERGRVQEVDQILRDTGFFSADGVHGERAAIVANVTGKLVPAHLDPSVVLTNDGSSNPFRALGRVVPITTNVWTGVSSAGITVGWSGVDDQVVVGDDTPTFANPTVTAHMWDAFVPITFAAYEDWAGGESEILMMVADGKDNLEAQSFATGSGTNQPYGLVTALSGTSSQIDMATNTSFTLADLLSVKNGLPRRYRKNASFVMNEVYTDYIRQFGTADGSLYTVALDAERPDRVLGRNVYDASGMTSLLNASATNNSIIYGDLKNYLIADRVGTITEFIPNLFDGTTTRPTARRGWLVHGRTGADSINDSGFRMLVNPKTL